MTNEFYDEDPRVFDLLPRRPGERLCEAELDPGKADGLAELRALIAARKVESLEGYTWEQ